MNKVQIILPEIVAEEFARNRDDIVSRSTQSLAAHFRSVRKASKKLSSPEHRDVFLEQLDEIAHKVPTLEEDTNDGLSRVEKIFQNTPKVATSPEIKQKATDRGIAKKAPFHSKGNSTADAVIIELYGDAVASETDQEFHLGFVTHNTSDFSQSGGNKNEPHPDFAEFFDGSRSQYSISLLRALSWASAPMVEYIVDVEEELEERRARLKAEIIEQEKELESKIWYNRHQNRKFQIEVSKEITIVDELPDSGKYYNNLITKEIWDGASKSAAALEEKYPGELGPWTDFEWGMMNGKLSTLRWILGEDWDQLYT